MALRTNKIGVLLKMETAEGTHVSLHDGAGSLETGVEVIAVTEMPIPEISGEELPSNKITDGFQNEASAGLVGKMMKFSLKCEVASGGRTVDTSDGTDTISAYSSGVSPGAPYFHSLMVMSGHAFDCAATGNTITYTPDSDQALTGSTATVGILIDGRLFEAVGCKASCNWERTVSEKDTVTFEVEGAYYGVTDITAPSITLPTYTPTVCRSANFTYDSNSTLCATDWSLNIGQTITPRKCMNAADGIKSYDLTNRDPQISTTVESVPISTLDFYTDIINGDVAEMSIDWDVGTTATWRFTGDVQPTNMPHTDEDGLLYHGGFNFRVVGDGTKDSDYTLETLSNPVV